MQLTQSVTPTRLNNPQIIELLRKGAQTNPAFAAVCKVFSERERARQQVTVHSLSARMLKSGYQFSKKDYINVLKYLSNLGIGALDVNPSTNEVRGLKNIKITLQSIGEVAMATSTNFEKFNPSFDFKKLVGASMDPGGPIPTAKPAPAPKPEPRPEPGGKIPAPDKRPPRLKLPQYAVALVADFDGTPVSFPLPRLTTMQISQLLAELHSGSLNGKA